MKTLFKLQSKIYIKTKASYIIYGVFAFVILVMGIIFNYTVTKLDTTKNYNIWIRSSLEVFVTLSKNFFYILPIVTVAHISSIVHYKYRNEGVGIILLSKPIKRKTIYFTNFLVTLSWSAGFLASLWLLHLLTFIPAFIKLRGIEFSYSYSIMTTLVASLMMILLFSSLSSLLSLFMEDKTFNFFLLGIPFLVMVPFNVMSRFHSAYVESTAKYSDKFLMNKDNNKNLIRVNKPSKYSATYLTPNVKTEDLNSKYQKDKEGNLKIKKDFVSRYKYLQDITSDRFGRAYKYLYFFNLMEYFDTIANAIDLDINNLKSYSNVTVDFKKIDSSQLKLEDYITYKFKNDKYELKFAMNFNKEILQNLVRSIKFMGEDFQTFENYEQSKKNITSYFNLIEELEKLLKNPDFINEVNLNKSTLNVENPWDFINNISKNSKFQKLFSSFLIKNKIIEFDDELIKKYPKLTNLSLAENDFNEFIKQFNEEYAEIVKTLPKNPYLMGRVAQIKYKIASLLQSISFYTYFKYVNDNLSLKNKSLDFSKISNPVIKELWSLGNHFNEQLDIFENTSETLIQNIYSFDEIGKDIKNEDSHFKTKISVTIPWYLSIITLTSISGLLLYLGYKKHNKKSFNL